MINHFLITLFLTFSSSYVSAQKVPEYVHQWKADTSGCSRPEIMDSVVAYLEEHKPRIHWIKKHLGGKPQKTGFYANHTILYVYPSCEGGTGYDVQIFILVLKKRRYYESKITVIG